jgi:hypothetical protein
MSDISSILRRFNLLDDEDYLVPPDHPAVKIFIKNVVDTLKQYEEGKIKTPEQQTYLQELIKAKDYYDEVLDEEAAALVGEPAYVNAEEDDEEDDDYNDNDEDDEDDEEDAEYEDEEESRTTSTASSTSTTERIASE